MKLHTLSGALLTVALAVACTRDAQTIPPVSTRSTTAPAPASPAASPPAQVAPPMSPESAALLIRPHSPVVGPANARVTIVEVLDPGCEACRALAPVVNAIRLVYPEDVRVVVRYAAFHEGSQEAIRLLDAARRQGKFEQTLAALFDRQQEWSSHDAPNVAHIWKIAADASVDVKRAQLDAHDADVEAMLLQETRDIYALKVDRTPTFFVNERPMLKYSPEHLRELVASEIKRTQAPK